MKVHVHIGVHKTATTYIQARLASNLLKMNAYGIGYIPIWKFRASQWKTFTSINPDSFRLEDQLKHFFQRSQDLLDTGQILGLIISDENLIGNCGGLLSSGRLFPAGPERLAHLRKLLGDHEVTLFCAIRSYDTFLASAYCEGLKTNKKYVSFGSFIDRLNTNLLNWPKMLQKFQSALRPERIVVWSYETFSNFEDEIVEKLAFGIKLSPVDNNGNKPTYMSTSHTAIAALDAVAKCCGEEVASILVRDIAKALPKTDSFPGFQPWNGAELKWLRGLYKEHLGIIPANMWLNPAAETRGMLEST